MARGINERVLFSDRSLINNQCPQLNVLQFRSSKILAWALVAFLPKSEHHRPFIHWCESENAPSLSLSPSPRLPLLRTTAQVSASPGNLLSLGFFLLQFFPPQLPLSLLELTPRAPWRIHFRISNFHQENQSGQARKGWDPGSTRPLHQSKPSRNKLPDPPRGRSGGGRTNYATSISI